MRFDQLHAWCCANAQPERPVGAVAAIFKNGRREFLMSHISANNIDGNFLMVSISMLSG